MAIEVSLGPSTGGAFRDTVAAVSAERPQMVELGELTSTPCPAGRPGRERLLDVGLDNRLAG
jgi:hypothetical protein